MPGCRRCQDVTCAVCVQISVVNELSAAAITLAMDYEWPADLNPENTTEHRNVLFYNMGSRHLEVRSRSKSCTRCTEERKSGLLCTQLRPSGELSNSTGGWLDVVQEIVLQVVQ